MKQIKMGHARTSRRNRFANLAAKRKYKFKAFAIYI